MRIPEEEVLDSIRETLENVHEVESNLLDFLAAAAADPDALADLPPLQRSRAFLVLAQAATTLLSVRLRCNGIRPDDHPIRTEIERISLCEEKLGRFSDWSKAPLRPSTVINRQAATRVIGHSLPDLTPEQRHSMSEISRGEGARIKYFENHRSKKRRKHSPSNGNPARARAAAEEFLQKAARELLGFNDSEVKGPLQNEVSDEE